MKAKRQRTIEATPARGETPGFALPYTTVDVVIFSVIEGQLQVLLIQRAQVDGEPFPGRWALPGGFVDVTKDASLIACARRKLKEKTGLASPYLEQLGSWGGRERDPRGWSATHVYFALVPAADLKPMKGANAADVTWVRVDTMVGRRGMAFDHSEILDAAVERLRSKVEYTSLPAYLLPEPFTLPQLQRTYEVILGRPVDKSGFRTRSLAANFLQEVGTTEGESNRTAVAYRLRDRDHVVTFPRTFSPRGPLS
jgi:8-oxo-dGTP diphosphatase